MEILSCSARHEHVVVLRDRLAGIEQLEAGFDHISDVAENGGRPLLAIVFDDNAQRSGRRSFHRLTAAVAATSLERVVW